MKSFAVNHAAYSGPLDLLLSLIEKRKLFVNDISLSQVTEDYLSHIKNLGGFTSHNESGDTSGEHHQFPLHDVSDFIVIASTLILIKSRSLLPELSLTGEEEQSIENLEDRLREYQKYKTLSVHIEKLWDSASLFSKQYIPPSRRAKKLGSEAQIFAPAKDISVANLHAGIWRVIQSFPKKQHLPKVAVRKVKSLEEVIQDLTKRMTEALTYSFQQFTNHEVAKLHEAHKKTNSEGGNNNTDPHEKEIVKKEQKVAVIISFLAMLELVKQGMIEAKQHNDFGDILMESQQVGTPRY